MFFLKKIVMGICALFLIFVGGAGTQSSNTLLQGGGFLGLIIGLVILYIFAKMAWRAMGCLPSILVVLAIIFFIIYAIGGFSGGVGQIGNNIKRFLGQGSSVMSGNQPSASASAQNSVLNLLDEEDFDISISENFSSPQEMADNRVDEPRQDPAPVSSEPQQNVVQSQSNQAQSGGILDMLFGKKEAQAPVQPDLESLPVIYSSVRVVSGDTLEINGRYFRLYGIDAPELNQMCAGVNGRAYSCGRQAAAWLSGWLRDYPLECRIMQQDKRGNMAGTCSLGEYDIGAALVNAGWAVAYVKHTDIYLPYQVQAEENMRGLWQGEFYMPWDWRKIQARKPNIKIIKQKPKRKRTILNPI